jgi:hypothetical protein
VFRNTCIHRRVRIYKSCDPFERKYSRITCERMRSENRDSFVKNFKTEILLLKNLKIEIDKKNNSILNRGDRRKALILNRLDP